MAKKKLLIDFDGVIHDYRGYQGADATGPMIPNARKALYILERHFTLVCFTTHPSEPTKAWLKRYGFPDMKVTNIKEPAHAIIDDRAICFPGVWSDAFLTYVKAFQPHWAKNEDIPPPPPPPPDPPTVE